MTGHTVGHRRFGHGPRTAQTRPGDPPLCRGSQYTSGAFRAREQVATPTTTRVLLGGGGACGVGVLGRLVAVVGFFGAASRFFGVLGGVEDPAGGGVGESEVGEAL